MNIRHSHSYRTLFGYLGFSLICVGGILLLPLLVLLAYPSEAAESRLFIIPGGIAILAGYLLFLLGRGKRYSLERQQDSVLVVLFWVSAIVLSSLPFTLSGEYSFTEAVFEATSGWSTTGLSVVNVEEAPKIILMYRSILLFFGGLGIVLVMSTLLSSSGGMQLYNAEGHTDRLVPNLLESARLIFLIYSGFILSGMILYRIFGMTWFDAINHSIAAVSTGGFSTHSDSIGYYNSFSIELITIILMILGNIGFIAHSLLIKGKIYKYFTHDEFLFFAFLVSITIPVFGVLIMKETMGTLPESLRISSFQVISALTTTGFQTVKSFNGLSSPLILSLIFLMIIGGGIGSTAGGIKQYRILVLLRTIIWSLRDSMTFHGKIHYDKIQRPTGDEPMDYQLKTSILSFIGLYICLYFTGITALCFLGISIPDAMFEFASAMGTVGLSRGIMVADAHSGILWIGTFGMFIGRLEIIVFFIATHKLLSDMTAFLSKQGESRKKHAKN